MGIIQHPGPQPTARKRSSMIGIRTPDTRFASSRHPATQVGVPVWVSIRKAGFCYSLGRKPSRQEAAKETPGMTMES